MVSLYDSFLLGARALDVLAANQATPRRIRFGCAVRNHYGASEFFSLGYECRCSKCARIVSA